MASTLQQMGGVARAAFHTYLPRGRLQPPRPLLPWDNPSGPGGSPGSALKVPARHYNAAVNAPASSQPQLPGTAHGTPASLTGRSKVLVRQVDTAAGAQGGLPEHLPGWRVPSSPPASAGHRHSQSVPPLCIAQPSAPPGSASLAATAGIGPEQQQQQEEQPGQPAEPVGSLWQPALYPTLSDVESALASPTSVQQQREGQQYPSSPARSSRRTSLELPAAAGGWLEGAAASPKAASLPAQQAASVAAAALPAAMWRTPLQLPPLHPATANPLLPQQRSAHNLRPPPSPGSPGSRAGGHPALGEQPRVQLGTPRIPLHANASVCSSDAGALCSVYVPLGSPRVHGGTLIPGSGGGGGAGGGSGSVAQQGHRVMGRHFRRYHAAGSRAQAGIDAMRRLSNALVYEVYPWARPHRWRWGG